MVFYTYNNIGKISIKLWQSGGKGFWQRKINQLAFVYKHATACAKSPLPDNFTSATTFAIYMYIYYKTN